MSVPTNPHTLATWARFFAERGRSPGVESASQGRATLRTGSRGAVAPWVVMVVVAAPAMIRAARNSVRSARGTDVLVVGAVATNERGRIERIGGTPAGAKGWIRDGSATRPRRLRRVAG